MGTWVTERGNKTVSSRTRNQTKMERGFVFVFDKRADETMVVSREREIEKYTK